MFLLPIKLDRVSFETMGRQNLQKYADFLIESIVFCPLVPPSWISLVDPTSAMYASAIYVSYIYALDLFYKKIGTRSVHVGSRNEIGQNNPNYNCTYSYCHLHSSMMHELFHAFVHV